MVIPDEPPESGRRRPRGAGMPGVPSTAPDLSPGAVDARFRELVVQGRLGEGGWAGPVDLVWRSEGPALDDEPPGGELARRLSEADLAVLNPAELAEYASAAHRLAAWAERLERRAWREHARRGGEGSADGPRGRHGRP
jgi:hypothetical protein